VERATIAAAARGVRRDREARCRVLALRWQTNSARFCRLLE